MNDIKSNKYKINEKINLYKENLIKFIIGQKDKIIQIGSIDEIDYIAGILFLTETNRYFKQNKITIHSYYISYAFINIFNKMRKKMIKSYCFDINDLNHFVLSLFNNIDYLNSRVDSVNSVKNKINNNLSKFMLIILPHIINLFEYQKIHYIDDVQANENKIDSLSSSSTSMEIKLNLTQSPNKKIKSHKNIEKNKYCKNKCCKNKYCNDECYQCWISHILSKFFYILLQTARFLGSGSYNDPNLHRLAEYYANIFYTWFKSNDIMFINNNTHLLLTEFYENYLDYKNKLNYSLIELDLGSETLDEIIKFLDNNITENLSIKIK